MATSVQLPLDLIVDILIRLPVRSLARFRCASRSFRSLIDGQDFVNRYVNHSIETNSNLGLSVSVENSKWKRRSEDKVLLHAVRRDLCWYDLERHRVRSIVEIDDKGIDYWRQGRRNEHHVERGGYCIVCLV
ncbi:hypothetical protein AB3S75_029630 [Citrus x aurantiifolia]